MEELIKELREYAKHAQWQAPGKAADALEAQQARIAELEAKLGAKPNWKIVLLPEKQNGQSKG